jgi:hypothetical protein
MFGLDPFSKGCVWIFSTAVAYSLGSIDFKLNFINALLTGKSPVDTKFLKPKITISHLYS